MFLEVKRSLRKEDGGKWSGPGQSYNFSLNFMMQLFFFFGLVVWFDKFSNFILINLEPGLLLKKINKNEAATSR